MSILEKIAKYKVDEVDDLKFRGKATEFRDQIAGQSPVRDFVGAIAKRYSAGEVALIAEIKKASPSKGVIRPNFDVPSIARAYRDGGAACLSILTDQAFFQGSAVYLHQGRAASGLPTLRKDFLIDPIQVLESRAMGADCVLLILAMLGEAQAQELEAAAIDLGLHVLIEVHDEAELDRAHDMKSRLIGFNNRDLSTFEADLATSERLKRRLLADRLAISESGLGGSSDVSRILQSGIRGFLIGETLMKAPDLRKATMEITKLPIMA